MRIIIRVVGYAALLTVIALGGVWLAAGLTREALALALGLVVGVVFTLPVAALVAGGNRSQPPVRERIIYRVAELVDAEPAEVQP